MPDQPNIRQVINFSWNWNAKLFCPAFTTIRVHNPHKYQAGSSYDIQLNKREIGPGVIISIAPFRLSQMTPAMAYIDMGYPLEKAKHIILTMYKNKSFNYETQLFDYIVINMPEKIVLPFPDELFGRYVEAENPELFSLK